MTTVEARTVKPGDQLYDKSHYYARDKWVTIRQVRIENTTVTLATGSGDLHTPSAGTMYVFHAREGVAVRRLNGLHGQKD